jgi:hypothetical protein
MGDEDIVNAGIINIESLELQFKNTLVLYKQAYLDYIGSINTPPTDPYLIQPNSIYVSYDQTLSQAPTPLSINNTSTSAELCKAVCAGNNQCKGALYNSSPGVGENNCAIYNTPGLIRKITSPVGKFSAIIKKQQNYLNNILLYNAQLIQLNQQINDAVTTIGPSIQTITTKDGSKKTELSTNYTKLLGEKTQIDKLIKDNINVDNKYHDTSIIVEQSNSIYMMWVIITIAVILFTIKLVVFPEINFSLKYIFIYILGVLIILLTYHLNYPGAFMLWCIIILGIIFTIFGILPVK